MSVVGAYAVPQKQKKAPQQIATAPKSQKVNPPYFLSFLAFSIGNPLAATGVNLCTPATSPVFAAAAGNKTDLPSVLAAAASAIRSVAGAAIGIKAPSASFKNFKLASSPPCQSIEITSPNETCSVESKLANGYTTCRSIARFKCRAPYFKSVPSFSRNSRAGCVTLNKNRPLAVSKTRCCTIPNSISKICSSCAERKG